MIYNIMFPIEFKDFINICYYNNEYSGFVSPEVIGEVFKAIIETSKEYIDNIENDVDTMSLIDIVIENKLFDINNAVILNHYLVAVNASITTMSEFLAIHNLINRHITVKRILEDSIVIEAN